MIIYAILSNHHLNLNYPEDKKLNLKTEILLILFFISVVAFLSSVIHEIFVIVLLNFYGGIYSIYRLYYHRDKTDLETNN